MNTTLTSASSLITHIDGIETPAPGQWSVVPGHTWLILRARPGPLAVEGSAFGAAISGAVDIDPIAEHCRMSLTIDTRRLTSDRPAMARALADRSLHIDAVRTGRFGVGGWDIGGIVACDDEFNAFEAWIDYRGVYRRGSAPAYAWFTINMTMPAEMLGMSTGLIGRRRNVAMDIDILATGDESPASAAA